MTREEAIKYLEKADVTVYQATKTRTAEAVEMAIRSLEAWDKVIEELREEKQKENRPYSDIQIDAFRFGIGVAIDIVNAYLEVDRKE